MDKILMKNMAFFGNHGVLSEETTLGQKFFVDAVLHTNTKQAGLTDEVDNTTSYAEVYEVIKDIVENRTFKLLEALSETIASEVLEKFELVSMIDITIRKPEAPVAGIFDYFGIEIRRERNE